ncbi:MAG: hypothetical protein HOL22_07745 [Euryarchaeota archaeon]|jgi:hypothetical protein|nr:hypothetical protein [Euryarchaeota archaeon]HJL96797.1 hypothetical protein [Candidatus Poseidoniaceae archaeon]MBT5594361.1 hypothetical protein [Euryarchaeota archaeon]MBT5843634.1 hypothetical protein [Euryarchaeota archaeon]MBT6640602.1 hypothetical protein [Euryarchaeota archaeon]
MSLAEGEPVGLGTGLQAGAFMGLYLGFSLAVISVLTDPGELKRLVSLMCIPPMIGSILLGPFLARRKRPVFLGKQPLIHARDLLHRFNEGQGNWRVLSHVKSDGMAIRIDMHNLTNVAGVVDAGLVLAEQYSVKFIVGQGINNSRQPELRNKVLSQIEEKVSLARRSRSAKSIEVSPEPTVKYVDQQRKINRAILILLPIVSFFAWLEMSGNL